MTGQEVIAKMLELGWRIYGEPVFDFGCDLQILEKDGKYMSILLRDPIRNEHYVYGESWIKRVDREGGIKLR